MELVALLTLFGFFTLVAAGCLFSMEQGTLRVENRLKLLFSSERKDLLDTLKVQQEDENKTFKRRVLWPLWTRLKQFTEKHMSAHTMKMLEKKLEDAGYPYQLTPVSFKVVQTILGLGFFFISMVLNLPGSTDLAKAWLMIFAAGCFGMFYPYFYLNAKKKARMLLLERQMPDYFDMVNVSIEAGMGLDAALLKVSGRMEGPIAEEFLRTLGDMKLGKSRRDAFTELRDRVPSEAFQSVIGALIQADQFGIGMSKVLHAQTRRMRERRRQAAREQAMKAPVKMLIPMVLFIFPTLFIILLGPIVLQLMAQFK
ncbi:type II secretion system F family protein [Ammoniphilus sp. 3BR4]|uniref:type II secretion system F family protein n=1 Tax=Ammoniphilus sp. 3BR4 TaxID=3158265 RepID=UPI003465A92B